MPGRRPTLTSVRVFTFISRDDACQRVSGPLWYHSARADMLEHFVNETKEQF